jgi:alpha-L-glutamate ligase-like protein
LRERGILGINRRNAEFILDGNPRSAIGLVDDKLRVHRLCGAIGVPTPRLYAVVERIADVGRLPAILANHNDFVIKPAHGSGGRGVLVVAGRKGAGYFCTNRSELSAESLCDHVIDILSGVFSLGGQPDAAIVQQRVGLHPAFEPITCGGVPDVRILVCRGEPVMAMLRLPTRESNGRANLHQGGLGVGIQLKNGRTHHAVHGNRPINRHPDTGNALIGIQVPMWRSMLAMSRRVATASGLGYLGADVVLDPDRGPLLLEVNARPGLAIQNANGIGLLPILMRRIERRPAPVSLREFVPAA